MTRIDTTQWSLVLGARGEGVDARVALDALCRIYRRPVVSYIRAKGHAAEIAEDLTQEFFARFLEANAFSAADPNRGRFRAYLLTAVKHFLINAGKGKSALKRGGASCIESIDLAGCDIPSDDTPERDYDQTWAAVVLDLAFRRLRAEAELAGKHEQFARLRNFLIETPSTAEYEQAAVVLGMRRNTIAVTVHRMRERLRDLARDVIAETTAGPADLENELRVLRQRIESAAGAVE